MIASWMLYALLVSALVAAAAWVLEEVCRLVGLPVRFAWLGALLATMGLVALAPLRFAAPGPLVIMPSLAIPQSGHSAGQSEPTLWASLAGTIEAARAALAEPVLAAATLGDGATGKALTFGWIALSLGLLSLIVVTVLRSRGARRGWPLREIAGTPVRVAPMTGPAVLGLYRPEVVVPEWLLQAPPEEQRLVVLHEQEHIHAHDPLVLAAGCLFVALIPWNPFAWWMLLRLRLAVELDCDIRVLRGGVRPQTYGSLLIDMAGRGPGLSLGVPALAGSPSTLERRLRAMTTRLPRFAALRASALGTVGLAALVAACETRMPTAPEVEAMDVAAAELQLRRLQLVATKAAHEFENGKVTYFVNGKEASEEEARALGGDRIARINVLRDAGAGSHVEINVETHTDTVRFGTLPGKTAEGSQEAYGTGYEAGKEARRLTMRALQSELRKDRTDTVKSIERVVAVGDTGKPGIRVRGSDGPPPLVILDGVPVESSRMNGIDPDLIKEIEVLKGPAATRLYADPRAANGVIRITTKAGAIKR